MLALLRVHRNKFLAGLALLIVCGAGLGIREALSADADLQQYNGSAVWADDLTAASTLLPRDGKRITADSNAVGSAPVNRSLKQLKDYLIATHGGIFGIGSATRRTVKSLEADGTGGAVSTLIAGGIASSSATDRSLMTPTDVSVFKRSPTGGMTTISKGAVTFTNTADGGGNPARTATVNNAVIPLNTAKAWVKLQSPSGAISYASGDGHNITSCAVQSNSEIYCDLAITLDNTNYMIIANTGLGYSVECVPTTTSRVTCSFYDPAALLSCNSVAGCKLSFVVFGRQTT